MKNYKLFVSAGLAIVLTLFGCAAVADYRTTLKNANHAINSLDNLGTRDIELDYKDGGRITLRGNVSSENAKQRVEQAVLSVASINTVDNQLQIIPEPHNMVAMPIVKPQPPTDMEVGTNIRRALEQSDGYNLGNLEFTVVNGMVTLTGSQNSFRAVDKILSVVLMIDGVKDVKSQITVNGAAYPKVSNINVN